MNNNEIKFLGFQVGEVKLSTNFAKLGDQLNKKLNFQIKVELFTKTNNADNKLLLVELRALINSEGSDAIQLSVISHSVFRTTQPIDEDFLKSEFALETAPAIAFPYLRSYVTSISANSGFTPVIIPIIDFAGRSKQTKTEQGGATPQKAD